jgi:lipopolysaccharide transport system permease protein
VSGTIALTDYLTTLFDHRELLLIWTLREIKVRYKQSVLGAAWAILQPLALMLVFTVVFSVLVRVPTDGVPYPIFSYTALLAWTFFASSMSFAIPSLVNNLNLITKIYFPREILPIASVGAAFFDFLISSMLLIAVLIWYQAPITPALLWLPVLVGVQLLLTLGIVLPAAAVNVFYRDVRFVLPLVVQVWMYATPIIYPLSLVPEWLRPAYALNPLVGIIDSFRRVLLLGEAPDALYLGLSASISLVLAVAGYMYFKRTEGTFADHI